MYKICFYIPESHLEEVKMAMFAQGAGKIGDYDCCCWQVKGQGQFRALEGSRPFFGQQGEIEKCEEFRVEMVCANEFIQPVVTAMKKAHPYEEPAYDVIKMEAIS